MVRDQIKTFAEMRVLFRSVHLLRRPALLETEAAVL